MSKPEIMQKSQDMLTSRIPGVNGAKAAEFIEEALQMIDAATYEQRPYIGDRRLNVQYFLGYQWVMLNNALWPISTRRGFDEQVVLATDNFLNGMLRQRVSKVVSAVPSFEATSESSDQVSVWRAKQSTRYARAYWYYLNLIPIWRDALLMAGIYNTSFAEVYWNRYAGRVIGGKHEGDVGIRLFKPTQILVDPNADRVMPEMRSDMDAQWLFKCVNVTLGELKASAKEAKEFESEAGKMVVRGGLPPDDEIAYADSKSVSAEDRSVNSTLRLERLEPITLRDGNVSSMSRIKVYYFYQQPNDSYPEGRYAVILPDNGNYVIEYREELPYATKQLPGLFPFVQFWDVRVPGRLAGHSRFKDAREDQDAVNQIWTTWNQLRSVYFPTLFWDKRWGGADLDAVTRNNRVGNVVQYDSIAEGEKPFYSWPPELQAYAKNAMDEIAVRKQNAQEKMDSHDMQVATTKSHVSATAVETLQDQDELRVGNGDVLLAEQLAEAPATELILKLIKRKFDREREVRYLGDRRRTEIINIRAEDIEFSDIRLTPGSSSRRNQAVVRSELMSLVGMGLMTSQDPQKAEELRQFVLNRFQMEAGEDSSPDADDYRNAWNENLEMLQQRDVLAPSPGDNDVIHIREHRHLLKTAEFQNLDKPNPDGSEDMRSPLKRQTFRLVEAHCALHGFKFNQTAEATTDEASTLHAGAEAQPTAPATVPVNPQLPTVAPTAGGGTAQVEQQGVNKNRNILGKGA